MKRFWKRYADRIDAASLRERVMIFAGVAVVMGALLNTLLIDPLLREERRLALRQAQRQAETAKLQEEMQKLALNRRANPDNESRERLATVRGQLGKLESAILEEQKKFTAPQQMRSVLEEMITKNRRLRLMELKTLPLETLSGLRRQDGAKPAPGGIERLVYRHGVEVTFSGAYLDMLSYLGELEKLPTQMYWGRMELAVADYPAVTLKLTVYTLSLDPAWMLV